MVSVNLVNANKIITASGCRMFENAKCKYNLSLQVKGNHGEAEVEQEILLLEALQGPTHTEGHHVGSLDKQRRAENMHHAQTHDAHKTNLQDKQVTAGTDCCRADMSDVYRIQMYLSEEANLKS